MTSHLALIDALSLADLGVFMRRAARIDDGAVRLAARGPVVAAYVAVLQPSGLLDQTATVLGLRTFALAEETSLDTTVRLDALGDRIDAVREAVTDDAAPVVVPLPVTATAGPWAAISPPRSGWERIAGVDAVSLELAARSGIDEVAAAVPTGTGEQIVHRVRSEVWGRPLTGIESVPTGAAFAALSLGFLVGDEAVTVYGVGTWTRLSTSRGHVLVKRRGSSLG